MYNVSFIYANRWYLKATNKKSLVKANDFYLNKWRNQKEKWKDRWSWSGRSGITELCFTHVYKFDLSPPLHPPATHTHNLWRSSITYRINIKIWNKASRALPVSPASLLPPSPALFVPTTSVSWAGKPLEVSRKLLCMRFPPSEVFPAQYSYSWTDLPIQSSRYKCLGLTITLLGVHKNTFF